MVKQTAGHDALGTFAPKFAELNDDVLFGEVWSREKQLSLRDRSIVTVTALMAQGLTDSSFKYHLETAKKNGCNLVRRTEKGRLRRRGWGLRWEKAQKGGKGTNLRGFFED